MKKLIKKKKKGPTIDQLQKELLSSPEEFIEQIEKEDLVKKEDLPKKEIILDGETEDEQIASMTNDEMMYLLLDLKGSKAWIAYKKYILSRIELIENGLRTLDPNTQGTEMSRNQGIHMGLMDVEGYIISLEEFRKKDYSG